MYRIQNQLSYRASTFFTILGWLFFGIGLVFLVPVFDHLWDGYNVWWLGIGWDANLISLGILFLHRVFNPRFSRFLLACVIVSILFLVFGYAVLFF